MFEILDNHYVSTILIILLIFWISLIGKKMPKFVKKLFSNNIFRIFILFLIFVRGTKDSSTSILLAIAFVLTLDYLRTNEKFESIEFFRNEDNKEKEMIYWSKILNQEIEEIETKMKKLNIYDPYRKELNIKLKTTKNELEQILITLKRYQN
jgi:hypothetical protein